MCCTLLCALSASHLSSAGLRGQHSLRGSGPQRHSDACGADGAAPSESQPVELKLDGQRRSHKSSLEQQFELLGTASIIPIVSHLHFAPKRNPKDLAT